MEEKLILNVMRVNDFKDLFTQLRLQPPDRPLPVNNDLASMFRSTSFIENPPCWCSALFKRNREMKTELDLILAFKDKEDVSCWGPRRCKSAYALLPVLDTDDIPEAKYFVAAVKLAYQRLYISSS